MFHYYIALLCATIPIFSLISQSSGLFELFTNSSRGDSAVISWHDPDTTCKVGYTIDIDTLDKTNDYTTHQFDIDSTDVTQVEVNNLMPGYLHTAHVIPKLDDQCISEMNYDQDMAIDKAEYFLTRPNPPKNLKCDVSSDNILELTWDLPDSPTCFEEFRINILPDHVIKIVNKKTAFLHF